MLDEIATIKLKLSQKDEFSYAVQERGISRQYILTVNGMAVFYLLNDLMPGHPFTLKRSVRGTLLKVPSHYNCEYTFGPNGVLI